MQIRLRRFPVRVAAIFGLIAVVGLLFTLIDLSPNLSRLDARMLSGPQQGNYYALVQRLANRAGAQGGTLRNEATGGSVENINRLAADAKSCGSHFAIVQDGIAGPPGSKLRLVGRLRRSESVFFLGKNAGAITRFSQLSGVTIGIGPRNSGTDNLARRILKDDDFKRLGMTLRNFSVEEQLSKLTSGELALGVFVVDEDASLIRNAVRSRGLQIASFDQVDVIARRHAFLSRGRIGAGQYDPVALVPAQDKHVFRVGTLILGNGCAGHAQQVALLSLLSQEFPSFIAFNRASERGDLFPSNSSSQRFFENGGAEFADTHAPWLVDIMPPSNWVYVVMVISMFINITGFWHRFRLWRIDANTNKAEVLVRDVVGEGLTPREMLLLEPGPEHATPAARATLDQALATLNALRLKCRRQANSLLVPMGQEWTYRYSEQQMEETLTAIRLFRAKVATLATPAGDVGGPTGPTASNSDSEAPPRE